MKVIVVKLTIYWIASILFQSTQLNAAIVDNLTIGNAKALSLANAVTASPPPIDAIHFNPAGLTQINGKERQLKLIVGTFVSTTTFGERTGVPDQCFNQENGVCAFPGIEEGIEDPVENTKSEFDAPAVKLPIFGFTPFNDGAIAFPLGSYGYRIPGTKYVIATGVYAPSFAAGYSRSDSDPGRYIGQEFSLTRVAYFTPTVAMEVTERLSLGVGLIASWQGVYLDTPMRLPNFLTATTLSLNESICGESPTFGEGFSSTVSSVVNLCGGRLGPYDEIAQFEVDVSNNLATSFNVGLIYNITNWMSLGVTYRSQANAKLKGSYQFSYSEEWSNLFGSLWREDNGLISGVNQTIEIPKGNFELEPNSRLVQKGDVALQVNAPKHWAFGVSAQVTPSLRVNIDAKWTEWSIWPHFQFDFADDDIEVLLLGKLLSPANVTDNSLRILRNYQDAWSYGIGIEYQFNSRVVFRGGYEDRGESIPSSSQDLLVPIGKSYLYSFGTGFKWNKNSTIDIAFGYLSSKGQAKAGESLNANSNNFSNIIYNPYAGIPIKNRTSAFLFEINFRTSFN